jgi:hypothetical protein
MAFFKVFLMVKNVGNYVNYISSRMSSSGIRRRVGLVKIDDFEGDAASNFRMERISELGTALAVIADVKTTYCHVYHVCGGSVTNNSTTRVRIGYRIYSLWRL